MPELAYFDALMPILQKAMKHRHPILSACALDGRVDSGMIIWYMCLEPDTPASWLKKCATGRAAWFLPMPFLPPGLTVATRPLTMETELERLAGLAEIIYKASKIREGDLLIVHSNSGRNTVAIEMAELARKNGVRIAAVTSIQHSNSVPSRHPDGTKLMDVADLVIDNCGIPGDALVVTKDSDQRCGATSRWWVRR
jgi:hypothetical protein